MAGSVLIDTNILIYVFSNQLSPALSKQMNHFFQNSFNISVINQMEFLGWKEASSEQFQQATDFLSHARILSLDSTVIDKTIELKRQIKIKLPDAIIAATCLVNRLGLLTRNVKDFESIETLNVINPFAEKAKPDGSF
jgi:predicted nucleic acid-binding protein